MLLGAMQGVLLSILLFTKKSNHAANVVLGAAMMALSLDVFNAAYLIYGYYNSFPHFTGVTWGFPFLYGPIFYLYTRLISSEDHSFISKSYLHFIPFILVAVYGFIFIYLKSGEFKIALLRNDLASNYLPGLQYIGFLKPIHGLIYVFLTIQVVRAYNNRIKDSFSNIERINLNWLRHLIIGLSFVWVVVVMTYIVSIVSAKDMKMDYIIYMAASVLIYSIGYLSLNQPQIFTREQPEVPKPKEVISYQKSGLTDEEAQTHLKNLVQLMETDKPYLNSELTLPELAGKLSTSTHKLSEILNTRLNQSFYDFVNGYRVEEVKRRLAESESSMYSLLAIAFDSGFNSKSSFNTIFKKQTNLTPSQYRKQVAPASVIS